MTEQKSGCLTGAIVGIGALLLFILIPFFYKVAASIC